MASSPYRQWSQIPVEILERFIAKLQLPDRMRFSGVCKAWRSACRSPPPLLVLSTRLRHNPCSFFNFLDRRTYPLRLSPAVASLRCIGSREGWLVLTDRDRRCVLLNPFTTETVDLPIAHLETSRLRCCNGTFHRCAVSSAPTPGNLAAGRCIVVANHGGDGFMFCRPGDEAWSLLPLPAEAADSGCFTPVEDAIFDEVGLLFLVFNHGEVVVFKFDPQPVIHRVHRALALNFTNVPEDLPPLFSGNFYEVYVAASPGDRLWMIVRYMGMERDPPWGCVIRLKTRSFVAFRFDGSDSKWVPVKSFGGLAAVVGRSCSTVFPAAEEEVGFNPGCVYFTDRGCFPENRWDTQKLDMGVYCYEKGTIEPLASSEIQGYDPLSIWFYPSW